MREVLLKPVYDKDSFSKATAEEIRRMLYQTIFKPLIDILEDNTRWHSVSLNRAFETGRLKYADPYVTGNFTAALRLEIKKLGGEWNKTRLGYKLPMNNLPATIRTSIAKGNLKAQEQLHKIVHHLEKVKAKENVPVINFEPNFNKIIDNLSLQVRKATPDDFEIPMELSQGMAQTLKETYNLNLNLYIRDWADEQIYRLREKVDDNVTKGFRADALLDTIMAEYGVTENKARFLAKQETSLLVSKYRKERYTEMGLNEYMWSTSHDDRVRTSHKDLDKKRFSWDSPPVVDPNTGRRANPGEDFGCRCVAVPVLKKL